MATQGSETPKSNKRSFLELRESEAQADGRVPAQEDGKIIKLAPFGSRT
jgi:hypothetical protein